MQLFDLSGPFERESGFAFVAAIPRGATDAPSGTRFLLFEDDLLLGPPDSLHDTVRESGNGAFSLWGAWIYLSASDNSDPNLNGRRYCLLAAPDVRVESPPEDIRRQDLVADDDLAALETATKIADINTGVFAKFFRYEYAIKCALRRCGFTAKPRSILEVGCGPTPWTALRFLCDGAVRYVATDTVPVNFIFDRKTIDALSVYLSSIHPELASRLSHVMTPGCTARNLVVIGETPCEDIELAAPVEFITSVSALQRATKPAAAAAAFHRLLTNGGLMWHSIDLRDPRDFNRPFDFLYRESAPEDVSENRLRASDWLATFGNAGFEVVDTLYLVQGLDECQKWTADRGAVEPVFTEEHRKLLAPPFDAYALDDLSTLALQVLCRKP